MAEFTSGGLRALIPAIGTCGGGINRTGTDVLEKLAGAKPGQDLSDVVPKDALRRLIALNRVNETATKRGTKIDGNLVVEVFGSPKHTADMWKQARNEKTCLLSVAFELPPEVSPIAHTLLPIEDGVYKNGEIEIELRGLVPIGPQDGQLFAHLVGVFACECDAEMVETIKAQQLADPLFVKLAKQISVIDYADAPALRCCTIALNVTGP